MNDYFKQKLTEVTNDSEQLRAYTSTDSTVVIAGPGSGKTTVLTLKVIRLLDDIIAEPRGLACLTYSTESAREFKTRLSKLGLRGRKNVFLGTVHSFCLAEILTPFAKLYPKYEIPNPIRIISEAEKKKLFDSVNPPGGTSITEMDKERTRNIRGISRVALESYEVALQTAISFEEALQKSGFIDFISMVKFSVELIQNESFVRKAIEAKFPWFVIDEYQDLGRPLHEIVLSLLDKSNIKIFAVGDADQSIYDFQGAAPDYLDELSQRDGIKCIRLLNNYRSAQTIVNASEYVLNSRRGYVASGALREYPATMDFIECDAGMDEQYQQTVELVRRFHSEEIPYHEIAILVGKNDEVKALKDQFEKQGIPVYLARQDFRNTESIFWLQSCASWLEDKATASFDEISQKWIGFLSHKQAVANSDDYDLLLRRTLLKVLETSKQYKDNLFEWLMYLLNELDFQNVFDGSERYPDEIKNLKSLIRVAKQTEPVLTIGFIARLGVPDNQVVLSTRHSAKGLEFDVVMMLGMEKDSFPNYYDTTQRRIDEARRLCFVAVSRARKACILLRSKQLPNKYGKWYSKDPSPFWITLKEFHDANGLSTYDAD
ncbi:DNA/RNA helicase, superfamily I [Desulfitobacterium dichloroeliminans LMG P-21439]|uniref:DNA 3'-5' helicase n=1 Tax=Desulfitobacterium dichloroeliminans (strain LMG P-21439 / DCA1) TaxID=871963 RepID=L0F4U3_DESDL|nr:ATP-dependent helicase [Desulfitobacterium dichloroeliminans]AGA67686.1 DNA/RNA helicase, superfamily I [Desulfitobacterium dichloroeliminans LMG P-21439]